MDSLGKNLRDVRKAQRLTLAQLGGKTGLSASYLSQIERSVTMPSLTRLTRIAEALDVEVRRFFEEDTDSPRVVRANQGKKLEGVPDIIVELLSADPVGKSLQPYSLLCRPGTSREYTSVYPGDKCGFVLKGKLTVTVGEETFVLAAGDSIHFDRSQPHSWHNKSVQECMVIWTVSPPLSEGELET